MVRRGDAAASLAVTIRVLVAAVCAATDGGNQLSPVLSFSRAATFQNVFKVHGGSRLNSDVPILYFEGMVPVERFLIFSVDLLGTETFTIFLGF